MKKIIYYIIPLLSFFFVSCNENEDLWGGEGTLKLSVSMQSSITVADTRTALSQDEQDALKANCRVRIFNGDGTLIRKYQGLSTMPSELKLASGNYSVRVTAGDSVAASRTKKFYDGSKSFTVQKNSTTPVSVNCNITNTLATVTFDSTLDEAFESYNVAVSTPKGKLEFTTQNIDSVGYYMLTPEKILSWTFKGVPHSGGTYTKTGDVEDAKASTRYDFTFKFTSIPTDNGGGSLEIEVDETPIEENIDSVYIYQRPVITALDANNNEISLDSPLFLEENSGDALSLWVVSSCPLTNVELSCNNFTTWGLSSNVFGLIGLSQYETDYLTGNGITITQRNSLNGATLGVKFSQDFVKLITANEGVYTINLYAKDQPPTGGYLNETTKSLVITVSNATIVTIDVVDNTIWSSKATLRASVLKEPIGTVTFRYRKQGTLDNWSTVEATRIGDVFTADISGLSSNTNYEYVVVDGEAASGVVCSFTTEATAQPQNAGFENWSGTTPLLIYGANDAIWWDSGNHGSATMSKNVTVYDTSIKNSGNYSAKLKSQFVGITSTIGKFAAGNLFVGKYLATDGTDGVIGWGRPFTSRPKTLKGYVRYETGEVTHSSTDLLPKGSASDIGEIFIVLGDWVGETYSDKGTWPVVIKTKTSDRQLFDPSENNTGIIAYGAKQFTSNTTGDGMIEFTIDLDYRSFERRPTCIIIVASASKYGDYFTGSTSSTMWLDDLELIYE